MKKINILLLASLFSANVFAMEEADPILVTLKADHLEYRDLDNEDAYAWDITLQVGKDFNKVWIESEGEGEDGETETHTLRLLYGHAISPFWDLSLGFEHEVDPEPERDWASIGIRGVAPYFVESDIRFLVGEDERTALSIDLEKELMLTQRWVLSPSIELIAYGEDDLERGIASGLSSVEADLRLSYGFKREFAPYIGIHHESLLGDTADLLPPVEDGSMTGISIGIRGWF